MDASQTQADAAIVQAIASLVALGITFWLALITRRYAVTAAEQRKVSESQLQELKEELAATYWPMLIPKQPPQDLRAPSGNVKPPLIPQSGFSQNERGLVGD